MTKECIECMYFISKDDEGCKKTIFRATTNATGECPFFFHREKDSANTEKMEVNERTMVCFDGVNTWLEQTRAVIENDELHEETVELRLTHASIKKMIEVLQHISNKLVKSK